jgi:plastocyanin
MAKRGTRRVRFWIFLGGMLLSLGIVASAAWAFAQSIGATDNTYTGGSGGLTPTYTMDQGDRPTMTNGGASAHNVSARQNGPDGHFLFSTPDVAGGQQATVNGTQYLTAGTYQFFCTLHPTEMQATLVVSSNGTPQARPSASLSVRSNKLSKVSKKGILVAINTSAKVDGVSLVAKLGKATIGKANGLSLAAGPQFASVKLSKAGKNKLKGKSKASVSVTADIPFGPPASGKAKLT